MESVTPAGDATPASRSSMRHSLRLRVFVAVTLAALVPLLLVFLWSQIERPVAGRLWKRTLDATEAAKECIMHSSSLPEAELRALSSRHGVRVRILDASGLTVLDQDAHRPEDRASPVDAFFFGAGGDALDIDQELGPVATRAETVSGKAWGGFIDCQFLRSVVCEGIRPATDTGGRVYTVHVQATSAHAVRAVYALRYQLMRLMLLTLPAALLLGGYAARRVSRPIELLRSQALAKAKAASRKADLPAMGDEVGDLSSAFNALLAALEAKRSDNETFAADLVHELKTPVASVRAVSDALEGGNGDPERLARLARVLRESSTKLDRVVTQFLELARAEAGFPAEERAVVDLHELLLALASSVGEDERHSQKRVIVEDFEGTARVSAVPHRIEALVRELLENAMSFTPRGGAVRARLVAEGVWTRLEVSDEGPGIPGPVLGRVFERFFTTRGEKRGSGLGLAMVRAVAEAHGGRAEVRSAPGEGATFLVLLPRKI